VVPQSRTDEGSRPARHSSLVTRHGPSALAFPPRRVYIGVILISWLSPGGRAHRKERDGHATRGSEVIGSRRCVIRWLSWVWDNRQWVFSGIGIAILIGIYRLAVRYLRARNAVQSVAPSIDQNGTVGGNPPDYHESPTPNEIKAALGKLSPYQQTEAWKTCVGLHVAWTVTFISVAKSRSFGKSPYLLVMEYGKKGDLRAPFILTEVDVDRFPRLKIAMPGDQLRVSGVIDKLEHDIHLKEVRIDFL